MHASYVRVTYVARDNLTQLSLGWVLWLQRGGKMMSATSLCLRSSAAPKDKGKSRCLATELLGCPKVWHVL